MPISAMVNNRKPVKICKNCNYFYEDDFIAGCRKGVWKKNSYKEEFFYDPHQKYFEIEDRESLTLDLWTNGVNCDEYDGEVWIITELHCNVEKETFPTIDGRDVYIDGRCIWSIWTINLECGVNDLYSIEIPKGLKNNLTDWLHNFHL